MAAAGHLLRALRIRIQLRNIVKCSISLVLECISGPYRLHPRGLYLLLLQLVIVTFCERRIKLVHSSSPLSYAFHLLCSFFGVLSGSLFFAPPPRALVFEKHNHKQLENTKGAEDSPECGVLWRRLLLETLPLLKAFCFGFHEQSTATLCRRLDRLDAG